MKNVPMTNAAAAAAEKEARKAATEKRLASMRANLAALEKRAADILEKGDDMTPADRLALLSLVNIAYHDSGKIEGVYSVDSSAACEFCRKMISAAAADPLVICGCCYANADAWKEAAWRRHQLNAKILSAVLFTVKELKTLPLPDGVRVRFNEDGDTVNETMSRNYLRIAAGRPAAFFGYWYKNAPAVEKGLHAEGIRTREALPENIRFIHSSALIGFPVRALWFDDATFTVYPDAESTLAAVNTGAHECNGKRCRACGYFCYLSRRQESAVNIAEVLRCSASKRAAMVAAVNARKAQQEIRHY